MNHMIDQIGPSIFTMKQYLSELFQWPLIWNQLTLFHCVKHVKYCSIPTYYTLKPDRYGPLCVHVHNACPDSIKIHQFLEKKLTKQREENKTINIEQKQKMQRKTV